MKTFKQIVCLSLVIFFNTSCNKNRTKKDKVEIKQTVKLPDMNNQKTKFWNWFKVNKTKFENILTGLNSSNQEEINKLMDEFETELHKYNENIWFRMGGKSPFELIITAEGNADNFNYVIELVNESKNIENWDIIPFIQPGDISKFNYKLENFELTEKDVFFTYKENLTGKGGYLIETMFYVTDEKFIDNDSFKSSIIRIAETALGEYDFAKIIGYIDVNKVSNKYTEHESEMFPIYKLKEVSDKIKK